jgi:hypothetical protein
MEPRYDCTREQMIEKVLSEITPTWDRAYWLAVALCAWGGEHGNGYDWGKILAEAEKIVEERA